VSLLKNQEILYLQNLLNISPKHAKSMHPNYFWIFLIPGLLI